MRGGADVGGEPPVVSSDYLYHSGVITIHPDQLSLTPVLGQERVSSNIGILVQINWQGEEYKKLSIICMMLEC